MEMKGLFIHKRLESAHDQLNIDTNDLTEAGSLWVSVCSFNGILLCDVNWIKLKACASKSSFLYRLPRRTITILRAGSFKVDG